MSGVRGKDADHLFPDRLAGGGPDHQAFSVEFYGRVLSSSRDAAEDPRGAGRGDHAGPVRADSTDPPTAVERRPAKRRDPPGGPIAAAAGRDRYERRLPGWSGRNKSVFPGTSG